jgi:hypothetical protein
MINNIKILLYAHSNSKKRGLTTLEIKEPKPVSTTGLFSITEFGKKYHPFETEINPVISIGRKQNNNVNIAAVNLFLIRKIREKDDATNIPSYRDNESKTINI